MSALETFRQGLPEAARDIRLNLQSVMQGGPLTDAQRWGVALTSALTARSQPLARAVEEEARKVVDETVIDDARGAAALMAMNNVYYRFRHMAGKPDYSQKPARLRMNRIAKPASNKLDFELFCLVASAINACEACIQSHEKTVIDGGLTEDQVHDAVRIGAVFNAAALAHEMGPGLGAG